MQAYNDVDSCIWMVLIIEIIFISQGMSPQKGYL